MKWKKEIDYLGYDPKLIRKWANVYKKKQDDFYGFFLTIDKKAVPTVAAMLTLARWICFTTGSRGLCPLCAAHRTSSGSCGKCTYYKVMKNWACYYTATTQDAARIANRLYAYEYKKLYKEQS